MLVGREPERRTIRALLAAARVADSGVLVLVGEPGVGKTALLHDAESAVGDMRVLRAQGVVGEQYVPFAGLLQLVRPVLPLIEHIPAPQRSALAAALLLEPPGEDEPSRFAVGAATLSLLARAADDRPLAVLVDDAHLLDQPSSEALVFAARRLVSDPVALLATVRSDEPGTALWTALPALPVLGLDLEATAELLHEQRAVGTGGFGRDRAVTLHRATGGNPLAILEMGARSALFEEPPRGLPLPIPARLVRAFESRLAGLNDVERTTLLLIAAGATSVSDVVAAAARLGLSAPRLDAALDRGLVELRADRVEFHHPLVQSAVYGAAPADARRAAHRALAAVVPEEEIDRLAWHLSRAVDGPDEGTAVLLDAVAARATARGAHAIASFAGERAAELTADRPLLAGRLTDAGEAAWSAGMGPRARSLLDRALAAGPPPPVRAHAREVLGAVETRTGNLRDALTMLLAAAAEAEPVDGAGAVRLLADAVHVSFYRGDGPAALRAADAIERLLSDGRPAVDPDTEALGTLAVGMALVLGGSGAAGIERLRGAAYRLLTGDRAAHDRFRLPLRVQGALWLRDAGSHRGLLTAAVERMRETASLGVLPYLLMQVARDAATTDRWGDAESAYTESVRLARETGGTTELAVALAGLAMLNARQGKADPCRQAADAAEVLARRNEVRLALFWVAFARGDLAAGAGAHETAVAHYLELEAMLEGFVDDPDQSCTAELVESCMHLGQVDAASRHAARLTEQAAAKGQPWSQARAARARALCVTGDAEPLFDEALAHHARTLDRYETARTQLAFGSWLRRGRRRVDARAQLAPALEAFESLGATPWADRAARELAATGVTVRRSEDPTGDLTPQERQVAQLLAQGRTTREAAADLFLSPKTVEYHLRHVYTKLGIRSRVELAERFDNH